jgi:hypothetical protein
MHLDSMGTTQGPAPIAVPVQQHAPLDVADRLICRMDKVYTVDSRNDQRN